MRHFHFHFHFFISILYYILTMVKTRGKGIRLAGAGKKRPNKWIMHVLNVWKSTPGITYKQALINAKSSYKK